MAELLEREGYFPEAMVRAYYAAFYAARVAIREEGQDAFTHKGVLVAFNLLFVKPGRLDREVGRQLRHLLESRQLADYDDGAIGTREEAADALREASDVVAAVRALLAIE